MDDCSCGIMDARTVASSVWSPRSEGGCQEMAAYPGRLMLAPTVSLPARHSKSLDQLLGPDLLIMSQQQHQQPLQSSRSSSPKTLPRSTSTQLISNNQQHNNKILSRMTTPPATVPSRGKQRPMVPSCATLFPSAQTSRQQEARSAQNPFIGIFELFYY